jgi:hypothetical protein
MNYSDQEQSRPAETLRSVSHACKVRGFSRDSFYRFRELYGHRR